jgi:hypothetical protein
MALRPWQARDGAAQRAGAGVEADLGELGRGLDRGLDDAGRRLGHGRGLGRWWLGR